MSTSTLVNNKMNVPRMSSNALPVVLEIHGAAVRLLVEVVKTILQLSIGDARAEEGDRPELIQAGFPTIVVVLLVDGGPTAVRRTRRTHDDDQHAVRPAIMPEGRLLLGPREVGAAYDVEVGTAARRAPTHKHVRGPSQAAADLADVVSTR